MTRTPMEFTGITYTAAPYRLWVNEERTVFVRLWPSGVIEVATRSDASETWGPPVTLKEERRG